MCSRLIQLGPGFPCYVSSNDGQQAGSQREARFIYNEIFNDGCYSFSKLSEAPQIVDVGANIGLFSIYVKKKYPLSTILAFEPVPNTYGILKQNIKLHGVSDIKAHQVALGSESSAKNLTFYPNAPGNSTFSPGEKELLREALKTTMGTAKAEFMFHGANEVQVEVKTLSSFLEKMGPRPIDILKIDVEGAELQVLQGISDEHWEMIKNVVLETCELTGVRKEIQSMLEGKGFSIETEKANWSPPGATFYMLVAQRKPSD